MMPSTSASKVDTGEINEYVREYLRYAGFTNTLEALDLDIKAKAAVAKAGKKEPPRGEEQPRIYAFFRNDGAAGKTRKELNAEKEHKEFQKKYNLVLQAARQIFSVSVNCLQLLHSMKETSKNENLSETLENYKIQLGKYHKIIINEGKPEGMELITETVMAEHKTKFLKYFNEKNIDGLIEVLLSLRVNALQIAPELRKNLVYELIRNDIFNIDVTDSFSLLSSILDINNQSLKHAITSLISVVASTLKGVEYLTSNGDTIIIEKVIKIMKEQENGSVTQRFCIAILQKASVKESIIPTFVDAKMIDWVINLMNKSLHTKIHVFCLDFASAMLANIIHAPSTLQYLEANPSLALQVIESLLRLVRENVPVSVLMHILICLSYLSKENFQAQIEECQFVDRISEFVEYYSQINTADNEALEIDKKTVLDLCAHMFHPKDNTNEGNDTVEMNELKTEDRIREYENEQGELIFECFQDEVS